MKMPGEGTIYLSQSSKFLKPMYIGDTITAEAEIIEINNKKRNWMSCINIAEEEYENSQQC
ncbi:MaoC family dehydratase N-terminal domain-containing protein [Lachnobacterium bovis]|nr:MaoC family dehydratase N-terminal domain-containing protein [Lachnobacterium bovis]